MQAAYVARRFGVFLLIVWLAASLNFFLPRLSGQDPVRTKLLQQAALGGYVQGGIDEMTKEYERRFGLDKPLWRQYLSYLDGVAHLDFNYSIFGVLTEGDAVRQAIQHSRASGDGPGERARAGETREAQVERGAGYPRRRRRGIASRTSRRGGSGGDL